MDGGGNRAPGQSAKGWCFGKEGGGFSDTATLAGMLAKTL